MSPIDWNIILNHLNENISEDEQKILNEWSQLNRENQDFLNELSDWWHHHSVDSIENDRDFLAQLGIDPDKSWEKLQSKIAAPKAKQVDIQNNKWYWAAAAVVLLVSSAYLFNIKFSIFNTNHNMQTAMATYSNMQVMFSDGSIVTLDSGSSIRYPKIFNQKIRNVELTGQGYFEIERDEKHPFIVATNETQIEVLGTSFNIDAASEHEVIVSVVEGLVAFYSENQPELKTFLPKGFEGKYIKNQEIIKYKFNNKNFLSWSTQKLSFDNTPLDVALEDIARHFHLKFEYDPTILEEKYITASFNNTDINNIFQVLMTLNDINFQKKSNDSWEISLAN